MGDRILGLDIGLSGVKAVQVAAELNGRFRITAMAYYACDSAESVSDALRKIREDERLKSGMCIASLSADAVSFRRLQMPFRDRRKIRKTIDFELEPLLPYTAGEALTDFIVTGASSADSTATDLLAAAVPRATVEEFLQTLPPSRVPIVEVEAVPMALHLIAAGYDDGCYLLLDCGARQTAAVFMKSGRVFQVRSFAFGGETITAALAEVLGVDVQQAEEEKKQGVSTEVWEHVAPHCDKFFAELDRTLQYLHLRREDEKPLKMMVTGGGALCAPFTEQLSRYFSTPVERLDIRTMKRVSLPSEAADSWKPMLMNAALALALRGHVKDGGFNFRREATGGYALIKGNLKRIAVVGLIVTAILLVDVVAGFLLDQRRLADMKREMAQILRKSSPGITRIVDPVQQFRTRLQEARQFAGGSTAEGGALVLLQRLSETIPATTDFQILDLTYDGEKVAIKGQTVDFNTIEKIKRDLAASGHFSNLAVSGANLIRNGARVEFEMRMTCAR